MYPQKRAIYEFGDFRFDFVDRQLLKNGKPVALTPKALEILAVLLERSGRLVTKHDLLSEVWPDTFVEESNLAQNIFQLRKALSESNGEQNYIQTVPRRGYRFMMTVRERTDPAPGGSLSPALAPIQSALPLAVDESRAVALMPARRQARTSLVSTESLGSAMLFFLVLFGLFAYLQASRKTSSTSDAVSVKSIAVLPFQTIGDNTNDQVLGLGIADAVILRLGVLRGTTVLPTSSVFRYSKTDYDPLAAGQLMGVDAVLSGTVQHQGGRIRVTAQLFSLRNERIIWSGTFEEEFTDAFGIQDLVSERVASDLSRELGITQSAQPTSLGTRSTVAYEAYIRGLFLWNKRSSEAMTKAIAYFEQATEKDPNYGRAHAALADAYILVAYYGYDILPAAKAVEKAKIAAGRALEIDPNLGQALTALALMQSDYERNPVVSTQSLKRAIDVDPTYATAHQRYAWILAATGRLNEALAEMQRAQELDPLSPANNTALASLFIYARSYDEAIRYCKRVLELDDSFYDAHINLGEAYEHKGLLDEAQMEFKRAAELDKDNVNALEGLGSAYALMGRTAKARRILQKVKSLDQKRGYSYVMALLYESLKQKEQAYRWLEKAVAERSVRITQLRYDPKLDEMRYDQRFSDILRRHDLGNLLTNAATN